MMAEIREPLARIPGSELNQLRRDLKREAEARAISEDEVSRLRYDVTELRGALELLAYCVLQPAAHEAAFYREAVARANRVLALAANPEDA